MSLLALGSLYNLISELPKLIPWNFLKLCTNDANNPGILWMFGRMDFARPISLRFTYTNIVS